MINLSKTVRYNENKDDSKRGRVAQPSTTGEAISQKIVRGSTRTSLLLFYYYLFMELNTATANIYLYFSLMSSI